MELNELIFYFTKSLQTFRYARVNYLAYKLLETPRGHLFHNFYSQFDESFKFASQMSTLLVVLNILHKDSDYDKRKHHETISFEWILKELNKISSEFDFVVDECNVLLNSINDKVLSKADDFRNKYYAHFDKKLFGWKTDTSFLLDEQISFEEFDPIMAIIESVYNKLNFVLLNDVCHEFEDDYCEFKDIIDLIAKQDVN